MSRLLSGLNAEVSAAPYLDETGFMPAKSLALKTRMTLGKTARANPQTIMALEKQKMYYATR